MKKGVLTMFLGATLIILGLSSLDDSFARSGGGSGGRGSSCGKSQASPSRGFNPHHQQFHPEVPPAQNNYINKSPYFSPYYIPFNPQNGNDKVVREPLYRYEDNFKSQY